MGANNSKSHFIQLPTALSRFSIPELLQISNSFTIFRHQNPQSTVVTPINSIIQEITNSQSSHNNMNQSFIETVTRLLEQHQNFCINHETFQEEIMTSVFPVYLSNKIYSLFASLSLANLAVNNSVTTDAMKTSLSTKLNDHADLSILEKEILKKKAGLYTNNRMSFTDLICCMAIIYKGLPTELTNLVYYAFIDETSLDKNSASSTSSNSINSIDSMVMTKNSFEKSLLLSQYNFKSTWSPYTISEIEKSLGTGDLLPGGAKSFYQNSSDVISYQEFSNFITFYPNCATVFKFLSAGSGFADCQGNCPVGSSRPRYFSLESQTLRNSEEKSHSPNLKYDKESSFKMISNLTGFDTTQISTIWSNFQKMKVQNRFDRPAFDRYFHVFDKSLQDRLFEFLDLNGNGVINYKEVCYCLSFVVKGRFSFILLYFIPLFCSLSKS